MIKFLFLLMIIGLIGITGYQNLDYFTAPVSFNIDLKMYDWRWATPPYPSYYFWLGCFIIGLLITGMKGLFTSFRLGREIKRKDAAIKDLKEKIADLTTRLDVFIHDPYIKKRLEADAAAPADEPAALPAPEAEETGETETGEAENEEREAVETEAGEQETVEPEADDPETVEPDTDAPLDAEEEKPVKE